MPEEFYFEFEDVLPKTGWGLYYKFMIGMACASCFANASAFLCIPIAIPLSSCETEITQSILYSVFISFTIGRFLGGIVNCLCDIFGRKRLLTQSLIVNFATTFMAAFAYNSYMIIFAVFFLGISLEHQITVVKIHLAEILPKQTRGRFLALCDFFWMLGFLQVSLIAYYLASPSFVEHRVIDMRVTTWRMLFAISGGINLILACATALLEESPRFFLHVKKDYLAVLTLKQFYAINKSSYGNAFEINEDDVTNLILDYGLFYQSDSTGCLRITYDILTVVWKSIKILFSSPFLTITLPMIILKTTLSLINIVSLNIFLAKLVTADSLNSGSDIVYLHPFKNNTMCPGSGGNKIFYNFLMISTNVLIGQLLMIWVLDRMGRKLPLFLGMFLTGVSLIILNVVKDGMTKMIVCSFVMFSFSVATTAVSVVNIESYPTALRGTSCGVIGFLGVILSLLIIRFFHLYTNWFLILLGILFVTTSNVNYFVKDLKQLPMVE